MEYTMETLAQECAACQKCVLGQSRTNCVFGTGNPNADLMFVGEAPGEQEDLSGTPFVGRAGQLLDKFLYAVDIKREDVYIAKCVKSSLVALVPEPESDKLNALEHIPSMKTLANLFFLSITKDIVVSTSLSV